MDMFFEVPLVYTYIGSLRLQAAIQTSSRYFHIVVNVLNHVSDHFISPSGPRDERNVVHMQKNILKQAAHLTEASRILFQHNPHGQNSHNPHLTLNSKSFICGHSQALAKTSKTDLGMVPITRLSVLWSSLPTHWHLPDWCG